MDLATDMKLAK